MKGIKFRYKPSVERCKRFNLKPPPEIEILYIDDKNGLITSTNGVYYQIWEVDIDLSKIRSDRIDDIFN